MGNAHPFVFFPSIGGQCGNETAQRLSTIASTDSAATAAGGVTGRSGRTRHLASPAGRRPMTPRRSSVGARDVSRSEVRWVVVPGGRHREGDAGRRANGR
jgi:hypothetical protein